MTSDIERKERTMESDASKAIKFCIDNRFQQLTVRYTKGKGWRVDQKYCCKEHTPILILNSEVKSQ